MRAIFLFALTLFCLFPQVSEAKKLKVMMVAWFGNSDADTGFLERAKELGLDLEVTRHDLKQDKAFMGKLFRETKWKEYDFVFTNTTVPSKAAMESIGGAVPQIFVMVSYPIETGLVNTWEKSGKNITGASNFVSVKTQMDAVLKIKALKSAAIMYNPSEENNEHARNDFEKVAAANGIKTTIYRTGSDLEHVKKVAQEIAKDYKEGKIDGVFLPPSSFYNTNAKSIFPTFSENGIFSFTAVDNIVKAGATVGVLYSRKKLGRMAAERLKELVDGKIKIEESRTLIDDAPDVLLNKVAVEKSGLKVPTGIKFIE